MMSYLRVSLKLKVSLMQDHFVICTTTVSEGASYALMRSHLIYGRNISVLPSDRHFEMVHMNL